jgi:hypothetical protein
MIAALLIFSLGSLLVWLGWRNRKKVQASLAWPYVPGRVTSATVRRDVTRGDQDNADSISFVPVVTYDYQVEDQLYHGNRLAFVDQGYANSTKAFAALQPYPVNGAVWVFYNPAQPQDCVLERKASHNNFMLIVGIIMWVAAVAALVKS